ncbi:hypothetical protein HU200_030954 [Digitaria exilis]|uniref:Uncharacterized protein n=1 Tax=Digitaria exilis TaxID=1010633 RepID=A0A835BRS8_9POAL|nr:hypothetical protein HU200_030954 [Digitaria exilis]CAB3471922.1 unnamed protein product [Digitaria exilis]
MATSLGLVGHEMYSGASSYFFPPGGLVPADGNNGAVLEFPPAAVAEADFFLPEIMGARGDRPHDYYCSPPAQVFAANNVGGGAPENDMTMNM